MKAILTSSLGGQVKIDGKRLPAKLPETNGLLKCIKDVWKKDSKAMIISGSPEYFDKNDSVLFCLKGAFSLSDLGTSEVLMCDERNKEIFADVPVQDYIDSIWNDIADAEEEITDNPMYLILNLARVLAYLKDGLVLSKKEGGEWGINHIPEMYHGLMQDAMREYADGVDITYEINLAKDYAGYMVEQITNVRKKDRKVMHLT